jgi:hypothetical protein
MTADELGSYWLSTYPGFFAQTQAKNKHDYSRIIAEKTREESTDAFPAFSPLSMEEVQRHSAEVLEKDLGDFEKLILACENAKEPDDPETIRARLEGALQFLHQKHAIVLAEILNPSDGYESLTYDEWEFRDAMRQHVNDIGGQLADELEDRAANAWKENAEEGVLSPISEEWRESLPPEPTEDWRESLREEAQEGNT